MAKTFEYSILFDGKEIITILVNNYSNKQAEVMKDVLESQNIGECGKFILTYPQTCKLFKGLAQLNMWEFALIQLCHTHYYYGSDEEVQLVVSWE
jgi:hypothetical protein